MAAGRPGGGTLLAGLIGSPVRHSLSPTIHNAAFAATAIDWVFVAFDVNEESVGTALAGARALGFKGLSVTMPLKAAVAHTVDRLSDRARLLDAVNTVVVGADGLTGDNTDGPGFVDSLPEAWEPTGCRCVVLGAGGAARAVILALAEAGVAEIAIVNRDADRGGLAVDLAPGVARLGTLADVAKADLVVQATPVGMADTAGAGLTAVPAELLQPGQVVADLVYHPVRTPLLEAAAQRGAIAVDGVGMLVHQAAHAFALWTGLAAPVEAMAAAARAALPG